MSLKRKDAMRSKRNRQAFAFSDSEHEKINILIDKVPDPPTEARQEPKDRLQEVRQMVSEVTVIMKDNLEKVVEREGKLNTLSVRTEELEASSQSFKVTTTHVMHKYKSRHRRLICVLVVTLLFVLLLVGVAVYLYSQNTDSEEQIENTELDEVKLRKKSRVSLGKGQLQGKDSVIKREDGTTDTNRHFMKADMKAVPSFENSQDKNSMDRTREPMTIETKEESPILQCYTSDTGAPSPKDTKTTSASSGSQDDTCRSSETFPDIQQEPTQSLKQSNEQAASVFPVEIDFYSFHKSTEREPLQRHNAMRSRKNRSAVLFTETEQTAIANHVERSKSDTLPGVRDRRKRQPVSDEVRQQVQQAKTTMEDNAAKVQKTETILDTITLNVPSQITKCRSLEDLSKEKGASAAQKEQALSLSDNVTNVKKENSSTGTPSKIGGKTSSDAEKSTHHKKKKKQPPSSTDEPESKIAYVKKKAKRAKVFFREKLTDHTNNTKKEYRANDGNNTAVFYTDESMSTSVSKQPELSTTHQQQQSKQQSQQQQQAKESHLDVLRGQVQEVTNIMKSNVDEISKRGEKLEELETRSGRLEDLSNSFASTAASIQKKMKRRNRKVICAIISITTVILLVVTLVVVVYFYG